MSEQVNNFTIMIDILNEKENNVFYLLILSRISIKMKQIISCKNFKDVLTVMHFLCTWINMLSKVLKKSGQCKFVIPWKKKLFHAIQKWKAVLGTLQINFWTTIEKWWFLMQKVSLIQYIIRSTHVMLARSHTGLV